MSRSVNAYFSFLYACAALHISDRRKRNNISPNDRSSKRKNVRATHMDWTATSTSTNRYPSQQSHVDRVGVGVGRGVDLSVVGLSHNRKGAGDVRHLYFVSHVKKATAGLGWHRVACVYVRTRTQRLYHVCVCGRVEVR